MIIENSSLNTKTIKLETLESYIGKQEKYVISNKALFTGFQHRSKVEFLRFFIV